MWTKRTYKHIRLLFLWIFLAKSCYLVGQSVPNSQLESKVYYQYNGHFSTTSRNGYFRGNLVKPVLIYETHNTEESVTDIHQKTKQLPWKNAADIFIEEGKIYWIKTQLVGNESFNGTQFFHVSEELMEDIRPFGYIDTYVSNIDSSFLHQLTGTQIPVRERPYNFWATFVKIDISPKDTLAVYIKMEGINTYYPMKTLNLWHIDISSVFPNQVYQSSKVFLFFGILGVQMLFFLFLFFIEKDRIHFYLVLLILGVFLTRGFHIANFTLFAPFPFYISCHHPIFFLGLYIAEIGGILFTKTYFNYDRSHIFSKRIVPYFLLISAVVNIVVGFNLFAPIDYYTPHILFADLIVFFTIVLVILLAWYAKNVTKQSKRLFFIAFTPVTIAVGITIITDNISPFLFSNVDDLLRITFVIMLVSLSLVTGYRTNVLKKEKKLVQQQNLMNQQAILEKELQAEQLKTINQLKSRLYANITYEFRTPLTVISGMANKIKEQPNEWLEQGVKMIKRNSKQLLTLVNQLLDLSKLEEGKAKLNYQQGNIITYLKYIVESIHSLASSKNILLHFHAEEEEIIMDFDEEKLQKIVLNLLSNAVKFTSSNGHIYITIQQIIDADRSYIQVKVRDTGSGIPEAQIPYIFDRFYQGDNTNTRTHKGEGTGIGLALVQELVNLMKGNIQVRSKIQKGTTFTVLLPVHRNAPKQMRPLQVIEKLQPVQTTEYDNATNTEHKGKEKVLLIEDNADVQTYIQSCLETSYELLIGKNGAEGIEIALSEIPDVVITDVMMPIKDGFEVCHSLKQDVRTSHIPIVMLTAKADVDSKLVGLSKGADAYLSKPFNPEELLIRLQQLVESRKRLQAKYSTGALISEASPKTEDVFLQQVQVAILAHLEDGYFGPNELAKALNTSRTQLHRKLKALTSVSTSNYINKVKLQKAKEMLSNTEETISEIAYAVSFSSLNYFSSNFSKEFGISPRAFRKKNSQ